ncbi:MAG: peptide-methionine (S)-S-oxide reductase MsrA [Candidatus Sericytochromatia bacterium]
MIKKILTVIFTLIFTFSINSIVEAKGKKEIATVAGGCFWSMEAIFQRLKGVESVYPGFSGGIVQNPSYEEVCTGKTEHAESIQITYDSDKISYEKILEVFWKVHNPTTLNKQGADEGTQYRSVIFYHDKKQKEIAEKTKFEIEKSNFWGNNKVVTEIKPYIKFFKAESYHKDYYNKNFDNPYCKAVIEPKIKKLKFNFKNLLQ